MQVTIGIDIGGTGCKGALVARDGTLRARVEVPTDRHAGTKTLIGAAESLIESARTAGDEVVAIGVGAAGFVDHRRGAVTVSPNLEFDDPEITSALRNRFDLVATLDNDANAAAWGEYRFGSGAGLQHLAFVTLGTGIGSGFVTDGRLLRGATGSGAELGHTVVDIDGPRCPCGLRGCLERLASGSGIAERAREAVGDDPGAVIARLAGGPAAISAADVARAAALQDETALEVLRRAGSALGIGLLNVVNLFEPQAIVLGGGVVQAGEPYLGPARDVLARGVTAQRRRPVRLDVTTLGSDAGLLGAAALAWEAA